jgi:Protein of unknown function (DUF3071)
LETALQTFSPREIQARTRGGSSAEVIAAETGWPLDKVLRYAEPLLAERAYIAEQAQAVEVRRSGGGATLVEAARAALGSGNDAITWDAWRREDGKWIVSATFSAASGERSARWTYDPAGRNIHPLDEDARALMGARPAAVPDSDGFEDALDMISERAVVDDSEARPYLVAVPDAVLDEEPPQAGASSADAQETVTIKQSSGSGSSAPGVESPAAKKAAPRKPKARKGRASVPSWDEILFGATRPDDHS